MKLIDAIELALFVVFAAGVSLVIGRFDVVIGVGVGLAVFAAMCLVYAYAYQVKKERGGG